MAITAAGASFTRQGPNGGETNTSVSVTVPAGTDCLVYCEARIFTDANAPSAVTFNGVALTQVTGSPFNYTSANQCGASMWYLKAPASGAHTLAVTRAGNVRNVMVCHFLTGVDQTTTVRTLVTATGTSTGTRTVTLTTVSGDWCVDIGSCKLPAVTYTPGGSQTTDFNSPDLTPQMTGVFTHITASGTSTAMTEAMSGTGSGGESDVLIGIPFIPAAAGGSFASPSLGDQWSRLVVGVP